MLSRKVNASPGKKVCVIKTFTDPDNLWCAKISAWVPPAFSVCRDSWVNVNLGDNKER